MPSPNEIEVLRITREEIEVNKTLIGRRMGISSEYSTCLLDCLARHGFLEEVPAEGGTHRTVPRYKLTRKGALALLARLYHIAGQHESAVRRTLYLKAVVDEKISEMADYVEEVFPEKRMSAKKKGESRAPVSVPVRVK